MSINERVLKIKPMTYGHCSDAGKVLTSFMPASAITGLVHTVAQQRSHV